jgi:hypothetical protein
MYAVGEEGPDGHVERASPRYRAERTAPDAAPAVALPHGRLKCIRHLVGAHSRVLKHGRTVAEVLPVEPREDSACGQVLVIELATGHRRQGKHEGNDAALVTEANPLTAFSIEVPF